ncbi:MAG TPA: glycosyltransferase family 1 protein [Pyrinomonadaceae bacterium]|jgi:glycosyltransferase involved in cell wall biosynthesis
MRIGIDGIPLAEVKTGVGHYTFELAHHLALAAPDDRFDLLSHLPFNESALAGLDPQPANLSLIQERVNRITRHWWAVGLPLYIRTHSLDLFHGTNYDVPLWGGCPSVLTVHDLSLLLYSETHEARRVRRARRRLPLMTRAATMIIAPTRSVKREICEHLRAPADKVVVVPEAPRSSFRPLPPEQSAEVRARLRVEDNFILYVGTIEPRKNILTIVRAFEEVLSETPLRPQLVIAGKRGWLTDKLFAYIESAALGDRLHMTGYISDSDLRALYSSCGLMVFPALYEGAGLPPLEAMACGAPVITSDTPAISEMVGDAARLVHPTDYKALARAITELLADEAARRSLRAGGLKRASLFTWERAARGTYEVYEEALKKHRGGDKN